MNLAGRRVRTHPTGSNRPFCSGGRGRSDHSRGRSGRALFRGGSRRVAAAGRVARQKRGCRLAQEALESLRGGGSGVRSESLGRALKRTPTPHPTALRPSPVTFRGIGLNLAHAQIIHQIRQWPDQQGKHAGGADGGAARPGARFWLDMDKPTDDELCAARRGVRRFIRWPSRTRSSTPSGRRSRATTTSAMPASRATSTWSSTGRTWRASRRSLRTKELDMFVSERYLVTIHEEPMQPIEELLTRAKADPRVVLDAGHRHAAAQHPRPPGGRLSADPGLPRGWRWTSWRRRRSATRRTTCWHEIAGDEARAAESPPDHRPAARGAGAAHARRGAVHPRDDAHLPARCAGPPDPHGGNDRAVSRPGDGDAATSTCRASTTTSTRS